MASCVEPVAYFCDGCTRPEIMEKILKNVEEKLPNTKIVVGTMDDFYNALEQFPLDEIPIVKGDLADSWIHGVGTYPEEVGKLRALRGKISETEKLLSFGVMSGIVNCN